MRDIQFEITRLAQAFSGGLVSGSSRGKERKKKSRGGGTGRCAAGVLHLGGRLGSPNPGKVLDGRIWLPP